MRLPPNETKSIRDALGPFLNGHAAELYLYGSRVQDHLKGGDIDLLVLTNEEALASSLSKAKHRMLAAIEARIGERKVDLKIAARGASAQDAFIRAILPTAVILAEWHAN